MYAVLRTETSLLDTAPVVQKSSAVFFPVHVAVISTSLRLKLLASQLGIGVLLRRSVPRAGRDRRVQPNLQVQRGYKRPVARKELLHSRGQRSDLTACWFHRCVIHDPLARVQPRARPRGW